MRNILVWLEQDENGLLPSTPKLIQAATQMAAGGEVSALIMAKDSKKLAEQAATIAGIGRVLTLEDAIYTKPTAEALRDGLLAAFDAVSPQAVLAPTGTLSRGAMARLAARKEAVYVPDVLAVDDENTLTRPIYAGALQAKLEMPKGLVVATVRASAFEAVDSQDACAVDALDVPKNTAKATCISVDKVASDRPDLTSAKVVVSGGRALGSKEKFELIENLADAFAGAVGASRAAVDAGYAPNDWQVGQTGKIVAPDVYFAIGISGAVQHLAGIKGAKTIVAINKDANAPIFKMADYGIVADLFEVVPVLLKTFKK